MTRRATPKTRTQVVQHQVPDFASLSRANDSIVDAANQALAGVTERRVVTMDLAVGANRINHGLGAKARGAYVTPTVADASYAYSFAADGDKQAVITVVGVAQPGATVEVFR